MESIKIKNFSFSYPLKNEKALKNINLSVNPGEYVVICGKSGCGKTTLLKHLKPVLAPHGERKGEILFGSKDIFTVPLREQTERIGYVMQDPDNQTVTDKVFHEIAFGLENLGLDSSSIRLRAAEMAEYFGISSLFEKDTAKLSGGQKQLLNLASVMAMHPDILILDEPVSQLDPVAASDFLGTVNKINKELGVTVIITEHRLEEIFPAADKIIVMDKGEIKYSGTPSDAGSRLSGELSFMFRAFPSPMRIYSITGDNTLPCPVTVRDGRQWLSSLINNPTETEIIREKQKKNEKAIELRDIYFRYEKKEENILKGVSAVFEEGKITAVLGGNGAGKSTLLNIIGGIYKPLFGKVKKKNIKISLLPQQVQSLFTEKTVKEDLLRIGKDYKEAAEITEITRILDCHPYDISGGERQRAALCKVLMTDPDVLLLDEPTKGMDAEFKEAFASVLKKLAQQGKTVITVSHDIEFCACHCHVCMMLFDGKIVSSKEAKEFFAGNMFYTTAAHRMSRNIFKNAVTDREVYKLCKKNLK